MKFRLSSLLGFVLLAAVLTAWWVDRASLRRKFTSADRDATQLATELYKRKVMRLHEEPFGSAFPPGTIGFYSSTSEVIDLTTSAGRAELLARLQDDEISFRVRTVGGRIFTPNDLPDPPWLNDPSPSPSWSRKPTLINSLVPNWAEGDRIVPLPMIGSDENAGEPADAPKRSVGFWES